MRRLSEIFEDVFVIIYIAFKMVVSCNQISMAGFHVIALFFLFNRNENDEIVINILIRIWTSFAIFFHFYFNYFQYWVGKT